MLGWQNHWAMLGAGAGLLGLSMGAAVAQDYPIKPIRIITPGVGNSFDIAARQIAQAISGPLGQPVIVDNRPPGVIPGQVAAQSPADGYTLLYSGATLWLGQFLQKSTPYDVVKDFQPITLTTRSPTLLVVHPSLPVKSVKELIALAKSRPGAMNYASGSTGSINHLTAELFKSMARVNLVRIGYRGSGPALLDLIAGQVQLMFSVTGSVAPHLKSGRLKVLAVTSAQPTELAPGVPTVAATGLPGFESESNAGIFAPAKLPRAITDRLNQEIVRALRRADVKEKFIGNGVEPVGSTPEQFEATFKAEMVKLGKVIKDADIREE
jgi:tripartite-type tricarboxylate transporter receptor subunit TctC